MSQIISGGNFNPATLQVPDLYISITPPPAYIAGVPANTCGVVGSASWGPLNTPILMGSTNDLARAFGSIGAPALTDPYDLATDVSMALAQAQGGNSNEVWGVRVGDGTQAAATSVIKDSGGTNTGVTLTGRYTGILGNSIVVSILPGAATGTATVAIVGFPGSQQEIFPNIVIGSSGAFWSNLVQAINSGISGFRGPSLLVTATIGNSTLGPTIPTTATFTGGSDGRTGITTADLLGSDTAVPKTGLYSMRSLLPAVNVVWIVGLTDSTAYAAMQGFADSEGCELLLTFPTGTSSSTAVTDKLGYAINDYNVTFVKDWIYFYDAANGVTRLIPPLSTYGGVLATLPPGVSTLNKRVFNVVGTERQNPFTGTLQYSNAEIGQLAQAGIDLICNPIPAGTMFGIRIGRNSSSNPVTSPIEYGTMTNFLAHSFAANMGIFVGQNQSQEIDDPLRASVRQTFNAFLQTLVSNKLIDAFTVICDLTNNSPASIAAHFLYCTIQVTYLSSVWYFVVSLQGGTTVVTIGNTIGGGSTVQL
jgi:phage tail sheath protein FI